MIVLIKTKTSTFSTFQRSSLIDYRNLGHNIWGDWYHEINIRATPIMMEPVLRMDPNVMDFAFDGYTEKHNEYFRLLYQEIKPVAFT